MSGSMVWRLCGFRIISNLTVVPHAQHRHIPEHSLMAHRMFISTVKRRGVYMIQSTVAGRSLLDQKMYLSMVSSQMRHIEDIRSFDMAGK